MRLRVQCVVVRGESIAIVVTFLFVQMGVVWDSKYDKLFQRFSTKGKRRCIIVLSVGYLFVS